MATRSRTTFKKRQKELARLEKQRDKAARRMQRKLEKHLPGAGGSGEDSENAFGEMGEPVGPGGDMGGEPEVRPHTSSNDLV